MSAVKGRRQEYAEVTHAALVDAGIRLFAEQGYLATSIEDVVREARVSAGALYHHFRGKKELFRIVQETVQQRAMDSVGAAIPTGEPSREWITAGLRLYLNLCLEPTYRAIVLQEGPTALGWTEWREVDHRYSLPFLEGLIGALIEAAVLRPRPVALTARVVCAAVGEAALSIAAGTADAEAAASLLVELVGGIAI